MTEANQRLTPGIGAFEQWMSEGFVNADRPILAGDSLISSGDTYNALVHNALIGTRSKNWTPAYEDAKKSIDIRPSAMGYISKALAQAGKGELEDAMQVFDLAFGNCHPDESHLLLLIKAIVLFLAGKYDNAISRVHDLIAISRDDEIVYCCTQVVGKMYLMQGTYEGAVQSLERGRSLASICTGCHLETITTIFGWAFDGFQITMQRYHCEALRAAGRAEEAAVALLKILDTFSGDAHTSNVQPEWITTLKKNCIGMLEAYGDKALSSEKYEEAIARYSTALSLSPSSPRDFLLKRSEARALKGLWEDALTDADEAIKLDPLSHLGYEKKHIALYGAEHYDEANNALLRMLSIMEKSPDEEVRRLREEYPTPPKIIHAIDTAIREIFTFCPLVLIDLTTGRLCDARERIQMFESETTFKKLVCDTATMKLDRARIRESVAKYFKWIMFSHTWEGKEPTFQDVNLVNSVWSLDQSPLNEKLRQFCTTAREDGHRWAWSDTCCIDKNTSAILSQSLTSMYTWYEEAAETLVYLADVLSSSKLGDLTKSRWMTRAWTLQELLASKVIRFYCRDWKPYLNDTHANHKESPAIKEELANAMGVAPWTITSFRPEYLGVREKLRLASTRNASVEEDVAYSLIGMFSSDIIPRYGLGKIALGQLLESVVARTGDVTVIAWTGNSLPYNTALPDSLAVYNRTPYSPPPMDGYELDRCVEQLRTQLTPEDISKFYKRVIRLPRATFSNRCLHLPCIMFVVTGIGILEARGSQGIRYHANVSLLGKVEFRTADVLTLTKPRKLVFIHPWLHDLNDDHDEPVSDDEFEGDSDPGPLEAPKPNADSGDTDDDDDSDASAPASPLHAPAARVDRQTHALRLFAHLGRPFNALLLERQPKNQYKRVATEHEIIIQSGVPYQTNPKDIRVKVLEIV